MESNIGTQPMNQSNPTFQQHCSRPLPQTESTSVDRLNQVWPVLGLGSPGLDFELNAEGQMCLVGGADANMA